MTAASPGDQRYEQYPAVGIMILAVRYEPMAQLTGACH